MSIKYVVLWKRQLVGSTDTKIAAIKAALLKLALQSPLKNSRVDVIFYHAGVTFSVDNFMAWPKIGC